MPAAYLPRNRMRALEWMKPFAARIVADPSRYHLLPADAASIASAVDAFASALSVSESPATRTPVAVRQKDRARSAAEAVCRRFYSMIKADQTIDDPDKRAIGVRPLNRMRSRRSVPPAVPLLGILAAYPGRHLLCAHCADSPNRRGKPFGAIQLQLFIAVGERIETDPARAMLRGCYTASPLEVRFDHAEDGKLATYFARWVSARGEAGGFSTPVSLRVAA